MTTFFPVNEAFRFLESMYPNAERNGLCLRWPDHYGFTELRVEPINYRVDDGRVVREVVTVTHTVIGFHPTAEQAAIWNRWATLSALLPGDGKLAPGRFVCKAGIFEGDRDAAERIYAPLLCTEASILGWHAASLVQGNVVISPDQSPLEHAHEPPPFTAADHASAALAANLFGLQATSDAGLAVRFPWEPRDSPFRPDGVGLERTPELDAINAHVFRRSSTEKSASLLQIVTNQPHALYGNGVLVRLELPLAVIEQNGPLIVEQLNRWELATPDLPPLFGAWCMGTRTPTFVTFVPNQMCGSVHDLLRKLLIWNGVRHEMLCKWLLGSNIWA